MEALFYAVLAICGVLVTLRALMVVARTFRDERAKENPRPPVKHASEAEPENAYAIVSQAPLLARSAKTMARVGLWGWRYTLIFSRRVRRIRIFSRLGLTAKMMIVLTATLTSFGLLTTAIVHTALSGLLRRHVIERAGVMATSVADNLQGVNQLDKKDLASLGMRLREYTMQKSVAYVVIEDRQGKLMAHSFSGPAAVIRRESPSSSGGTAKWNTVTVGNRTVYEMTAASLKARVGAVRLGVWRSEVDAEISSILRRLTRFILYATATGILVGAFLVWRINRPIRRLIRAAKSLGTGDLGTPPLDVEDATECGELSRALERLRSSVKAAMTRLDQES